MINLKSRFESIYGSNEQAQKSYDHLLSTIKDYRLKRKPDLKRLDHDKQWVFSPDLIGYTLYIDLFAKDFISLIDAIPYLSELGITFVHIYLIDLKTHNNPSISTRMDFIS